MVPNQGGLLPEMGKSTGDYQFRPSPAEPDLSIQAVDQAFPRTEPTFFEQLHENMDLSTQLPFFIQADIGWDRTHVNPLYEATILCPPRDYK